MTSHIVEDQPEPALTIHVLPGENGTHRLSVRRAGAALPIEAMGSGPQLAQLAHAAVGDLLGTRTQAADF